MFELKSRGLKWLKGFHLLAVACWLGGAVSLIFLYFLKKEISEGNQLYGINLSIQHIDMMVVVIPGAIGSLLTGLIYSVYSRWGFFKHNWVIFKWIVTILMILSGTFYLGPWENSVLEISGELGINALADENYLYYEKMNFIFGSVQIMLLIITVFVSIFKPWKRKKPLSAE